MCKYVFNIIMFFQYQNMWEPSCELQMVFADEGIQKMK